VSGEPRESSGRTIGFLAVALGCAVLAGVGVITATVLLVDALRSGSDPANLTLRFYLLFGGTLAGVLLAAFAGWRLLGPMTSTYRRGGLAIVCSFATVLAMLVCIPVNQHFGRAGLLVLLALSGFSSALLARRAGKQGARA
jgi:hypothetical protein